MPEVERFEREGFVEVAGIRIHGRQETAAKGLISAFESLSGTEADTAVGASQYQPAVALIGLAGYAWERRSKAH
jgi:hypothetical protein